MTLSPSQRRVLQAAVDGVLPDPTGSGAVAVYRALARRGLIEERRMPHPSGDPDRPWRKFVVTREATADQTREIGSE